MSSESQEFQPQDETLSNIEIFDEKEAISLKKHTNEITRNQYAETSDYKDRDKQFRHALTKSEYGKSRVLLDTLKDHLMDTPMVAENQEFIKTVINVEPTRRTRWWNEGAPDWKPKPKTRDEVRAELSFAEWGWYDNSIKSNEKTGYLEFGMQDKTIYPAKERDSKIDDDNDIKFHVNPNVADIPLATFAVASAREKLKTLGIDIGFKVAATKDTSFKDNGSSEKNPPRLVVYSFDQDPEKLKTIAQTINEALGICNVENDSTYTPRFCEQIAEGSPIYLAQGKGNDKATDSNYRSQYGEDGLFKDNARPVVDSLKNSLQN